ncbi:MAG TPA: hypothetical protein VGR76_05785 [Candidatus Angelobacter sp.]|jgi:hypothetical protein|nr:hypothetical protein [Candidatus Angelobacter sp.]
MNFQAQQIFDFIETSSARQQLTNSALRSQFHCHGRYVRQAQAALRLVQEAQRIDWYCSTNKIPPAEFATQWKKKDLRQNLRHKIWSPQ